MGTRAEGGRFPSLSGVKYYQKYQQLRTIKYNTEFLDDILNASQSEWKRQFFTRSVLLVKKGQPLSMTSWSCAFVEVASCIFPYSKLSGLVEFFHQADYCLLSSLNGIGSHRSIWWLWNSHLKVIGRQSDKSGFIFPMYEVANIFFTGL